MIAIRCVGLRKTFGSVLAVDGLDLEVQSGECFGLLGPNGAGKTTSVEIMEGLTDPTSGVVEILGTTWTKDAERLRARIGLTLQDTQLPELLTVAELIDLFRSFYPSPRGHAELLAMVGLKDKAKARFTTLSGGQKQRLAVACGLAGDPELVFLDEPTTGLDPQARRQLWDVVTSLRAKGRTVLLTTHYMDEAERLCDRIAIVDRGRVIAIDTPRALIETHIGHDVQDFGSDGELIATRRANLEDVFVKLTGRALRE